jgi:hypothetical protein
MASVTEWSGASSAMHLLSILFYSDANGFWSFYRFLRRLGVWGFPVYRSGFTLAITLVILAILNALVCDPTPTFRRTFRSLRRPPP